MVEPICAIAKWRQWSTFSTIAASLRPDAEIYLAKNENKKGGEEKINFLKNKKKRKEKKEKEKKTDGDRTLNNRKFRKLRNKGQQRNDSEKQKGNWSSWWGNFLFLVGLNLSWFFSSDYDQNLL